MPRGVLASCSRAQCLRFKQSKVNGQWFWLVPLNVELCYHGDDVIAEDEPESILKLEEEVLTKSFVCRRKAFVGPGYSTEGKFAKRIIKYLSGCGFSHEGDPRHAQNIKTLALDDATPSDIFFVFVCLFLFFLVQRQSGRT